MIWRDTAAPALDDRQSTLDVSVADHIGQPAAFAQVRLAALAPRLCGHVQPFVPIDIRGASAMCVCSMRNISFRGRHLNVQT